MLTPRPAGPLIAATLLLLAGCAGSGEAGPAASTVIVTADDSRCDLDRTQLEPGAATFKVTNKGNQVTEVYVYGPAADGAYTTVISEVENIGPGLSRDLTAELSRGTYEVACKPGQTGSGIRSRITVAGDTTSPTAEQEAAYDRELELSSDGHTIRGDLTGARVGEKIEFKLANNSDRPLILELKNPTGAVAGETEPILPRSTGEIIVNLKTGGEWALVVESDGQDDITAKLPVT
jgi:hypothetical protein